MTTDRNVTIPAATYAALAVIFAVDVSLYATQTSGNAGAWTMYVLSGLTLLAIVHLCRLLYRRSPDGDRVALAHVMGDGLIAAWLVVDYALHAHSLSLAAAAAHVLVAFAGPRNRDRREAAGGELGRKGQALIARLTRARAADRASNPTAIRAVRLDWRWTFEPAAGHLPSA